MAILAFGLVPARGLEPRTLGLKDRCSTRLSYAGMASIRIRIRPETGPTGSRQQPRLQQLYSKTSLSSPDQYPVHGVGGFLAERRHHVTVNVHRGRDVGVSERLHDHARADTLSQQQRGARVPEIVETDARQLRRLEDLLKLVRDHCPVKR